MDIAREVNDVMGRLGALEKRVSELEELVLAMSSGILEPNGPDPAQQDEPDAVVKSFEILGVDARITESNDVWSKFAWKLDLRSNSSDPLLLHATVQFLDQDGFVVDDMSQDGIRLTAGSEETVRGYALIDAGVVDSIDSVNAEVGVG